MEWGRSIILWMSVAQFEYKGYQKKCLFSIYKVLQECCWKNKYISGNLLTTYTFLWSEIDSSYGMVLDFIFIPFLQVIANSAVQTYTTELWKGGLSHWPGWRVLLFISSFVFIPPMWLVFALPLNNKYNKTPIVKFGCYLTSHIFFMVIQVLTACMPIYPIYR